MSEQQRRDYDSPWKNMLEGYFEEFVAFFETIHQFEEEQRMHYIATFERNWLQKGIEQGRQQGLEQGLEKGIQKGHRLGRLEKSREAVLDILNVRFEHIPDTIIKTITDLNDLLLLETLLKKSVLVSSPDEFLALPEMKTPLP